MILVKSQVPSVRNHFSNKIHGSFGWKQWAVSIILWVPFSAVIMNLPLYGAFSISAPAILAVAGFLPRLFRGFLEGSGFEFGHKDRKWTHPAVLAPKVRIAYVAYVASRYFFALLVCPAVITMGEWSSEAFIIGIAFAVFGPVATSVERTEKGNRPARPVTVRSRGLPEFAYNLVANWPNFVSWIVGTAAWLTVVASISFWSAPLFREWISLDASRTLFVIAPVLSFVMVIIANLSPRNGLFRAIPLSAKLRIADMAASVSDPIRFSDAARTVYVSVVCPLGVAFAAAASGIAYVAYLLTVTGALFVPIIYAIVMSVVYWIVTMPSRLSTRLNSERADSEAASIAADSAAAILVARQGGPNADEILSGALESIRKGIESHPHSALLQRTAGDVFCYGIKDYAAAVERYSDAVALEPSNPENYRKKAAALYEMGDEPGAAMESVFASVLDPENPASAALLKVSMRVKRMGDDAPSILFGTS